jgi:outer membrane lipoprotein SlyB
LVVLFALIFGVIGGVAGEAIGGENAMGIGAGVGLVASAIATWIVGIRLNDPAQDRVLVDPQTGQRVVLRRRHSLFWIPMQWWAPLAAIAGIILALVPNAKN